MIKWACSVRKRESLTNDKGGKKNDAAQLRVWGQKKELSPPFTDMVGLKPLLLLITQEGQGVCSHQ